MPVKREIPERDGIYFITFTCWDWLPLIAQTNAWDAVYKFFDVLKAKGHYIVGYVIMPNHLHLLIAFRHTGKPINRIISNGKRFLAYEIVKRLKAQQAWQILQRLSAAVTPSDRKRGKEHQVFRDSFDWKECESNQFIEQKLSYIHANPCEGKWQLVRDPVDYPHSSAKYYETGRQGLYAVTEYSQLEDIDLTK